MIKTVIVNMPMTMIPQRTVYVSDDRSLAASDRECTYPVVAFLGENLVSEDKVKFVLLAKKSSHSKWEQRVEEFKDEINLINEKTGADISFEVLDSGFAETKYVHEKLMEEVCWEVA